jgi:tRNA (cmo5U34)-methyltransferase
MESRIDPEGGSEMGDSHRNVVSEFNQAAHAYDDQRRKLIPCFDDFYNIAVSLAETDHKSPSILDLGAGTGLLSSMLLARYPTARLTLIDISDRMMDVARLRFANQSHVQYIVDDYTNYVFESKFDLIVSALSIHHLTDSDKKALYQNTYDNLRDGGVFVNADQVLGNTMFIDSMYKTDWTRKVEASGLRKEEILAAYERTKLDQMSPLDVQIGWLRESGFSDVDCVYKYYNFVVLFARKMG